MHKQNPDELQSPVHRSEVPLVLSTYKSPDGPGDALAVISEKLKVL